MKRSNTNDDGKKGDHFGYLKVTMDSKDRSLTCKFIGVRDGKAKRLDSHKISI